MRRGMTASEPCCSPALDLRFHVALDSHDLAAAVTFYSQMFGLPPAKLRRDYAKFELDVPPLVLALNAVAAPLPQGRLSHLGMRLPSHAALAAVRQRFAGAGLAMRDEVGTTCCYARQDKVWVRDPDGNEWEFYVLLADVDAADAGVQKTPCCEPG